MVSDGCDGMPGKTRRCGTYLGQSTVEYAIVFVAFIAIVVGLGTLWRFFDAGTVCDHALTSASHHLVAAAYGTWADALLY